MRHEPLLTAALPFLFLFTLLSELSFSQKFYRESTVWIVKVTSAGKSEAPMSKMSRNQLPLYSLPHDESHPASRFIKISSGSVSGENLEELVQEGVVEYFELDAIGYGAGTRDLHIPNDPGFDNQWYVHNDGSFSIFNYTAKIGADINLLKAWEIEKGDSTVVVAVLDTGINPLHSEFAGRLWSNTDEIPGNGVDDDRNGYTDDTNGWNFVTNSSSIDDDNGHGTAIAGVIAANVNNEFAYAGINQKSKLMVCKVLGSDQSGFYSNWIAGIYYAVDNGAHIINMSVEGTTDLKSLKEAIQYAFRKGVLVVCSMGNGKTDSAQYPAAYEETIAVGSTDPTDQRSLSFNGSSTYGSNFGKNIDLVAPGNAIYGLDRFSSSTNTLWGGTSMATAVVTGVASLLLSMQPLTPNELKGLLYSTSVDQIGNATEDISGWDQFYGFGRVNAFAALNALQAGKIEDPFRFSVFPNPTPGILTCKAMLSSLTRARMQIIDTMGRTLVNVELSPKTPLLSIDLDLSMLQPAVYIVMLNANGRTLKTRVIKR